MNEPSEKSPEIDKTIARVFGFNRRDVIRSGICPGCNGPATEFRDALSLKEHSLSGLCQNCQDELFQPPKQNQ
jgi:hypothetical protein